MRSHATCKKKWSRDRPAGGRLPTAAVAVLLTLFEGARRHGRPADQDALNWNALSDLGLTPADVDALLAAGHLKHLEETTGRGTRRRTFDPAAGKGLTGASRFVLTERGAAYFREQLGGAEAGLGVLLRETAAQAEERPCWDAREGTLRWRGEVVKRVRIDGDNQRCVLNALQKQGWPRQLDNPLPRGSRGKTRRSASWRR
jgi:hypothetical protein